MEVLFSSHFCFFFFFFINSLFHFVSTQSLHKGTRVGLFFCKFTFFFYFFVFFFAGTSNSRDVDSSTWEDTQIPIFYFLKTWDAKIRFKRSFWKTEISENIVALWKNASRARANKSLGSHFIIVANLFVMTKNICIYIIYYSYIIMLLP